MKIELDLTIKELMQTQPVVKMHERTALHEFEQKFK